MLNSSAMALPPTQHELRIRRRRFVALCVVVFVVVAVAMVLITLGGATPEPPAEGAAELVPADTLAYVHISTDAGRSSVKQALKVVQGLPGFPAGAQSVTSRLAAIAGGSEQANYASQIRPWLGREAALAFLDTPAASAQSLTILDVANAAQARAFVAKQGAVGVGRYRETALLRYPSGTELAFVGHYLVLGTDPGLRASIDVFTGDGRSLADDGSYRRAQDGQPPGRVLEAYASGSGLQRVLGAQGGLPGALAPLLFSPALEGLSAAVGPASAGASIRLHSVFDPQLARVGGRSSNSFTPTLTHLIPAGSPFVLDLRRLDRAAPRLLGVAAAAGFGIQIRPLLQRLGTALAAEGVNVSALQAMFEGESAIAVTPAPSLGRPPSLTIVARSAHPAQASQQLASLQIPLAQLFSAPAEGAGQTPVFNDRQMGGITAHQLSLTPGVELDYAVFRGLVVISTSLDGIAAIANPRHAIADEREFASALSGRPGRVGSLLFLDFSQLLSLGEQTGITQGGRIAALLPDLQRIHAVGLSTTGGEDDSTAELTLQIP
jgi:Protein of unknown function (DUF3352)